MKSDTGTIMALEPGRMRAHLLQLKSESILTDITITCCDKTIPTHKCILAASSLFFKLLFTDKTVPLTTFDMNDITTDVRSLENIIDFAYTGTICIDEDNFGRIVGLSYFLAVSDLTELCSQYLNQSLTKDNCLRLYLDLYKSSQVTDITPVVSRAGDIQQIVWEMVESKFYDHIIVQENILQISTEDMLHVLSKGIVKNFCMERVLEFIIRWIGIDTEREKFEIAEMFTNLILERVQLSTKVKQPIEDRVKVTSLIQDLIVVMETADLQVEMKTSIIDKLLEIQTLIDHDGCLTSTGYQHMDTDSCDTKQEVEGEPEDQKDAEKQEVMVTETIDAEKQASNDRELEIEKGEDNSTKITEVVESEEVIRNDDGDMVVTDPLPEQTEAVDLVKHTEESTDEQPVEPVRTVDEAENQPTLDTETTVDEAENQPTLDTETTVPVTWVSCALKADGTATDLIKYNADMANTQDTDNETDTAVNPNNKDMASEAKVSESVTTDAKAVEEGSDTDVEMLGMEHYSSFKTKTIDSSDTDEETTKGDKSYRLSIVERVKMLNFEKSVQARVKRCLDSQTQQFAKKILKNTKMTALKKHQTATAKGGFLKKKRRVKMEKEEGKAKKRRVIKKEIGIDKDESGDEIYDDKKLDEVIKDSMADAEELLYDNLYVKNVEDSDKIVAGQSDQDWGPSDSDDTEEEYLSKVRSKNKSKSPLKLKIPKAATKNAKTKGIKTENNDTDKKEVLTCEVCNKTFRLRRRLKVHMETHDSVKPFKCVFCGCYFRRGYHLMRHMTRLHPDETSYKCDECDETFDDIKKIVNHTRIHSSGEPEPEFVDQDDPNIEITVETEGKKTYGCKVCNKSFSRLYHIKRHLKVHEDPKTKSYPCDLEDCSSLFMSKEDLREHTLNVHGKDIEAVMHFKCEHCSRLYQTKENFDKHMRKCDGKRNFPCDQCGATFRRQYHLDRHKDTHNDFKSFQCSHEGCRAAFKREYKLKEHMKKHSEEPGSRSVICELCGAVLSDVRYLKRHLDAHSGLNKHRCEVCLKTYTQAVGLKIHMRIHTGVKPYQCEICSQLFAVKSNLMRHQRRHRGDRRHKCDQCGKGFVMMSDLKRHYTMHTGEKNYPCKFCGKKFSSKSKVPQHERIHTGEKPYQCGVCGKRFIQNGDRKRHEQTHGGTAAEKPKRQPTLFEIANGYDDPEAVPTYSTLPTMVPTAHMHVPTTEAISRVTSDMIARATAEVLGNMAAAEAVGKGLDLSQVSQVPQVSHVMTVSGHEPRSPEGPMAVPVVGAEEGSGRSLAEGQGAVVSDFGGTGVFPPTSSTNTSLFLAALNNASNYY